MSGLFGQDYEGELAGLLMSEWNAEQAPDEVLTGVSIRMTPDRVAVLDMVAQRAGISRNRVCNMLIAAGLEQLLTRLPDGVAGDFLEQIHALQGR